MQRFIDFFAFSIIGFILLIFVNAEWAGNIIEAIEGVITFVMELI